MKFFDPYDLWASPTLGRIKQNWYQGNTWAGILLRLAALSDWLAPMLVRKVLKVEKHTFPHVEAMQLLSLGGKANDVVLRHFRATLTTHGGWGLPFGWYSKNGIYDANTPYVTNTPYVMEALLILAKEPSFRNEAMAMFDGTWDFLESLKVMEKDEGRLALSYAPVDEPRLVVNANSYAAFAYALHAMHGNPAVQSIARDKALRLVRWVIDQQNEDGGWYYYADQAPGNFIDGFHSCFVLKNLLKVKQLLPEVASLVDAPIERGWLFIRENLFDANAGLCRRFAQRSHRDPFKWELYDQAEYLGLLVDFGLIDEAREFSAKVERRFRKGEQWYCRIDILGRLWGREFLRWGIVPFKYHQARLQRGQEVRH